MFTLLLTHGNSILKGDLLYVAFSFIKLRNFIQTEGGNLIHLKYNKVHSIITYSWQKPGYV
jgi:hypothetical protein